MTISKKTVFLSLTILAFLTFALVAANPWWLLLSFAVAAGYGGYKIHKVHRSYFGKPYGPCLRRADLTDVTGQRLGHYYVHADGKNAKRLEEGHLEGATLDERGLPIVDYGSAIGKQYNVCTTAQYAIEYLELFLQTESEKHRDVFLKLADWLVQDEEDGRWYYRFEYAARGLGNPWISSMAQGQAISVLLRAWQFSGNAKYVEAAKHGFALFELPIDRGGVALKTESGTWFEEYPSPLGVDHVMNGHIWALFGIWDMYRATQNSTARRLFDEGIAVLKADLHKYDNSYWVVYDQRPHSFLVDSYYMHFQIDQVRVLHAITQDPLFAEYVARWEGYLKSVRSSYLVVTQALRSRLRSQPPDA